jgi:VanZ family protein
VKALGHAALFAPLGLLAAFVPRSGVARRMLVVAPVLLLYAGATEALWSLIAHRQPRVEDVVLAGVAAAMGLAVGVAIAAIRRRRT